MNREQQGNVKTLKAKQAVAMYMDSDRNASTVAKKMNLSRERIRQLLDYAVEHGIMPREAKRSPLRTKDYLPTVFRIIKTGGDIFDISFIMQLPVPQVREYLNFLLNDKSISEIELKRISRSQDRLRITNYLKRDTVPSAILKYLLDDGRAVRAAYIYSAIYASKDCTRKEVYTCLALLHINGLLSRALRGWYEISPDFKATLSKYVMAFNEKGGVRVN